MKNYYFLAIFSISFFLIEPIQAIGLNNSKKEVQKIFFSSAEDKQTENIEELGEIEQEAEKKKKKSSSSTKDEKNKSSKENSKEENS